MFDPGAVAEKILDPVLVPLIERAVAQAKSADRKFLSTETVSFADSSGTRWIRG